MHIDQMRLSWEVGERGIARRHTTLKFPCLHKCQNLSYTELQPDRSPEGFGDGCGVVRVVATQGKASCTGFFSVTVCMAAFIQSTQPCQE